VQGLHEVNNGRKKQLHGLVMKWNRQDRRKKVNLVWREQMENLTPMKKASGKSTHWSKRDRSFCLPLGDRFANKHSRW